MGVVTNYKCRSIPNIFLRSSFFGNCIGIWTFLSLFSAASGQTLPQPPKKEPPLPPRPETLPSLPELLPPTETTPAPVRLAPDRVPGTIVVKKFEVIGDRVLGEEIINAAIASYLFRPLSFIELLEVQSKITELYVERGYITTGAFIPPQAIAERTVKIEIIEGKIAEINISGLKHLQPEYIRSRLEIASKPPFDRDKLLNTLKLLQLNPLIEDIKVELSAGIEPGTSFLNVNVREADAFNLGVNLDNLRPASLGSFRRQIELSHDNLWGYGDRIRVAYSNSDGTDSLENLSYALPINAYNTTITLTHSRSQSQIINGVFKELNIGIKSRYYEADLRQPIIQNPTRNADIGVIFSHQNTITSIDDLEIQLARGATADGKTKISALRFWQEYSDRNTQYAFVTRSQFSLGIAAFGSSVNDDAPNSNFFIWRGQTQYFRFLTDNIGVLLKGDLQLANRALVSLEQYNSGGGNTVRGYPQDILVGDNGLLLSAEFPYTILRTSQSDISLSLIPLFDFARAWNSDDFAVENNTLISLGIGLQLLVGENISARIDWGTPLIDLKPMNNSLQEQGIHFSFNLQAF